RWTSLETPQSRARLFVAIWFCIMLAGTSALPRLTDFFRVRYSILFLIPVTILLGWIFSLAGESAPRLPRWALTGGVLLLAAQAGINADRALAHRRELGHVMLSTDHVYAAIETRYPKNDLVLGPDFQPYDYRPGSWLAAQPKDTLSRMEDVAARHAPN